MIFDKFEKSIENVWNDRSLIHNREICDIIEEVIDNLDKGRLRVASFVGDKWVLHDWVRKSILLYFMIKKNKTSIAGDMEFYDKIDIKKGYKEGGVRIVPPAVVRYGAFINSGAVIMPSYINIGSYIDSDSMIDIGACVGSCAQIGNSVHLSAGVVIGGVLEPIQNKPVIIEDKVFIGANSTIVEGITVGHGAVIGAGVCITGSTKIIEAESGKEIKGFIPPNTVVIPGSIEKNFGGNKYNVPCALIIGKKKKSTAEKVAINEILRD